MARLVKEVKKTVVEEEYVFMCDHCFKEIKDLTKATGYDLTISRKKRHVELHDKCVDDVIRVAVLAAEAKFVK